MRHTPCSVHYVLVVCTLGICRACGVLAQLLQPVWFHCAGDLCGPKHTSSCQVRADRAHCT